MKKFFALIILAATILSVLVSQVYANQIKVFAPLNYAGNPPSFPTGLNPWGTFATPATSTAFINPATGDTTLNAIPGPPTGWALSWFDSGWHNYTGPTQKGAAHSDMWLNYRISGWGAGIFAYFWIFEYDPSAGTFQYWTKTTGDGLPGARHNTFDLGVIDLDLSNLGNPFFWNTGHWYYSRMLLLAIATPGTTAIGDGKYDDILYIGYQSSPEDHWDALNPQPLPPQNIQPALGPTGTNVTVSGGGLTPNATVNVLLDGQKVAQGPTDAAGNYSIVFPIVGRPGIHVVTVFDDHANLKVSSFFDIFTEATPLVGDINGDGKVDLFDIGIIARNFGKTDPNMPPGSGPTFAISTIALAAGIPLGFYEFRKRRQNKTKPDA